MVAVDKACLKDYYDQETFYVQSGSTAAVGEKAEAADS